MLAVIEAVVAEANGAVEQQTAGLADLNAGLTANEASCKEFVSGCGATGKVGIMQFKDGAKR